MKRFLIIFGGALLAILLIFLGFKLGENQATSPINPTSKAIQSKKQTIYPSLFITGSSGSISNMEPMVNAIVADKAVKAQQGLDIVVNDDHSLSVTGKISTSNEFPTIIVGMSDGTNNSLKYEEALKAVMSYLSKNYNVPWTNMLGYSAGGSGVYRYLIDYGSDKNLPPVKKWLSLDGQYNASTPQPTQTIDEVLKNGPADKSQYYAFWEKNYKKFPQNIQVSFLAGDYDSKQETDGVVPWADTFSVYHFLVANGNSVQYHIFGGANSEHGDVPKNTEAIDYVKVFFYE